MLTKRYIRGLVIVVGLLALLVPTSAALDLRPEIHITLEMQESGGALLLEVPNVVREDWIESAKDSLSEALGADLPDLELNLRYTERNGKKFHAFSFQFDTVAEMKDALTGFRLPGILDEVSLPGLLDTFEYQVNETGLSKEYELRAMVGQESAGLWGRWFDVHYYVDLPKRIVEHNGIDRDNAAPMWLLTPEEELVIYARAHTVLDTPTPISVGWLYALLIVVATALLVGLGLWLAKYVRRRGRGTATAEDWPSSEPLDSEYGSWSEAMQDVDGVHIEDYDGEQLDDQEEELLDY